MTKKLLLIDGSSMLSTNFFGTVPREYYDKKPGMREKALEKMMKTSDGRYTNGVYAFSKMLLRVIKEQGISHVAIAWDISRNTVRKEKFADYKGTRSETVHELKSQFPLMQEVIEHMGLGLNQFKIDKYEADDIIGTLACKFKNDLPVIVMTKDQDALQLIDDKVRVWLNTSKTKDMIAEYHGEMDKSTYNVPQNFFEFTPDSFEHFYGIKPIQMIDKKAIEGDSSDNIPGVKGVGEKSVTPLLKEFGTVEAIYEYLENTSEKEVKEFFKEIGAGTRPYSYLMKSKEMAYLSKDLATIICDMDNILQAQLPELKNEANDDIDVIEDIEHFLKVELDNLLVTFNEETMTAKFKELQFNSLLPKQEQNV